MIICFLDSHWFFIVIVTFPFWSRFQECNPKFSEELSAGLLLLFPQCTIAVLDIISDFTLTCFYSGSMTFSIWKFRDSVSKTTPFKTILMVISLYLCIQFSNYKSNVIIGNSNSSFQEFTGLLDLSDEAIHFNYATLLFYAIIAFLSFCCSPHSF